MVSVAVLLPLILFQADPSDTKEQTQRWMAFYATTAGEYKIYLDGDEEMPLEFAAESILRYTNPERERGQHGAVFVWKHQGRPEAIGTIWSIRNRQDATQRRTAHELHSLSLSPLRAEHPEITGLGQNGKVPQWRVNEAGIKLSDIPDAPAASTSKPSRLVQMRRLASRFNGVSIARDGSANQLRLLSQPLMRYASPAAGVVDGALFAMVLGTDPELLLMIERRQVDGIPTWQFAAARCTGVPLRLHMNKKIVWQCEKARTWVGNRPYFFCVGVSQHDAKQPEQGGE